MMDRDQNKQKVLKEREEKKIFFNMINVLIKIRYWICETEYDAIFKKEHSKN